MNNSFDSLLKTACNIKSTYLNQDKKEFNNLPEFYKSGLYCYDMMKNVRIQKFKFKKFSFEVLRKSGLEQIKIGNLDDAHYTFSKALSIFKYIKSANVLWKTEGGIKDEELSYFEDKGENPSEANQINSMIVNCLLNISYCDLVSEKYEETRKACDEIIKRDSLNAKA